jgi:DNA-binding response OmpR family regulator
MTRTSDGPNRPSSEPLKGGRTVQAATNTLAQPRVLVVDTDRALLGLLEEWLDACGCVVVPDQDRGAAGDGADGPFILAIVDVPHPKHGGVELLQRVAREHPGTPVIALSSTFFSGIESTGGVARTLGVACVLPKPVARDSLITAVRSLLHR